MDGRGAFASLESNDHGSGKAHEGSGARSGRAGGGAKPMSGDATKGGAWQDHLGPGKSERHTCFYQVAAECSRENKMRKCLTKMMDALPSSMGKGFPCVREEL